MISSDFHSHHARCGHASGSIEEYIQAAITLGLDEIGISDHAPLYWQAGDHPQPGSAMARSELEPYVAEVLALRQKYAGSIRVLLGLEVDYIEGLEGEYRAALSPYPFDYLIGSVHYVLNQHIYDVYRWRGCEDPERHYTEYFRLIRASACSGLFDILGHTTGILAYGPALGDPFAEAEFTRTAAALAESGIAIEVNTS
ncbi:MAG: phosphoesterase, partial [Armatimonadetes bacterium]|nr:phosphoesterase [Armatimonadota bacterium]